jgi:hypothetical protein
MPMENPSGGAMEGLSGRSKELKGGGIDRG